MDAEPVAVPDVQPVLEHEHWSRAYDLDRAHVFHSWMAQATFKPLTIAAAQGSWVRDGEGNRRLDFSCQLVNTNIGHQHPAVVQAIQEQAGRLCTVAPQHVNDAQRGRAAGLGLAPTGLEHVFFTTAATEGLPRRGP